MNIDEKKVYVVFMLMGFFVLLLFGWDWVANKDERIALEQRKLDWYATSPGEVEYMVLSPMKVGSGRGTTIANEIRIDDKALLGELVKSLQSKKTWEQFHSNRAYSRLVFLEVKLEGEDSEYFYLFWPAGSDRGVCYFSFPLNSPPKRRFVGADDADIGASEELARLLNGIVDEKTEWVPWRNNPSQ